MNQQSDPWLGRSPLAQRGAAIYMNSVGASVSSQPKYATNTTAVILAGAPYSTYAGPNGDFLGKWAGSIEGVMPNTNRLDFYLVQPSTVAAAGDYLGYFDLKSDGTVTFTAAGVLVIHSLLSISDVTVTDTSSGTPNAVFTVTLAPANPEEVHVGYDTANGSALDGVDYSGTAGTLAFPPGTTEETITVPILPNSNRGSMRQFSVHLTSADAGASFNNLAATGTIVGLPALTVADASVLKPTNGVADLTFSVALAAPQTGTVTVQYAVSDGTATAGIDYVRVLPGQLVYAPGETNKSIVVTVNGNANPEGNKTISLFLSHPTGAVLPLATATGTILDNTAKVSISDAAALEPLAGEHGFMTFVLAISPPSEVPVTVRLTAVDGTAHAGEDFTPDDEPITFQPGEVSKTLFIQVNSHAFTDNLKYFYIDLRSPQGGGIGRGRGTGTIFNRSPTSGNGTVTNVPPQVTLPLSITDFNHDRIPDLLFQDASGSLGVWFMSGDDVTATSLFDPAMTPSPDWRLVGAADFDQDGNDDLLFQLPNGALAVWFLDGVKQKSEGLVAPFADPQWQAVAINDFNGDGNPDVLFQHGDGTLAIWYLRGGTILDSVKTLDPARPQEPGWRVAGTGDFNGDGHVDILFQHVDGTLAVWYLNEGKLVGSALLDPAKAGDPNWRVVGTTDQNSDGKPDLLWQRQTDGAVALWYMNGPKLILGKMVGQTSPGGTWRLVGR
jgi:hypothetical protein